MLRIAQYVNVPLVESYHPVDPVRATAADNDICVLSASECTRSSPQYRHNCTAFTLGGDTYYYSFIVGNLTDNCISLVVTTYTTERTSYIIKIVENWIPSEIN